MPYKDKMKQLSNNRLWKQKKKNVMNTNAEIPMEIPFSPKIDEYPMEEYRYDILYSVIQLREIMMTKTRYNYWLNKHLLVLDELHERFNK